MSGAFSLNQWNVIPSSNSQIATTNIAFGCSPSDVGTYMRTSMAQIAYAVQGTGGIAGSLVPATWFATNLIGNTGTIFNNFTVEGKFTAGTLSIANLSITKLNVSNSATIGGGATISGGETISGGSAIDTLTVSGIGTFAAGSLSVGGYVVGPPGSSAYQAGTLTTFDSSLSLNSGTLAVATQGSLSAGIYGSASQVAQVTLNADGVVTAASNVSIVSSIPAPGAIGDFVYAQYHAAGQTPAYGSTYAGASLFNGATGGTLSLSGTWRCRGPQNAAACCGYSNSLFQRVS